MGRLAILLNIVLLLGYSAYLSSCDGKADLPLAGTHLGDSIVDDGETRSDIDPGQLYTVTKIVEATSDIPSWANADLPFNTPRRQLGVVATDSQWPFEFTYTYPSNNYALTEARMLLVTSRDSSDTEGIFIDGILTGRPPGSMVSTTTTKVTHRFHSCEQAACPGVTLNPPPNNFFLDWAYKHYKVSTQNTFDIDLTSVLAGTVLSLSDLVQDGLLQVVTGDDAVVQTDSATASRPLLVLTGSTYSVGALSCSPSPSYKLINDYLHNDGNSIGTSAFTGSVLTPVNSYGTAYTTFRSVEFYFDPRLPTLSDYSLLNITKANLTLRVKRTAGPVAIVINGIGIDQTGFDRNTATATVETWSSDAAALAAWDSFVNVIPSDETQQDVTLNLLTLLGPDTIKTLLLQGKLNIAIAGPLARIYGQAATNTRNYGVRVDGPELILEGNYSAEICTIPDNPNSPLNGGSGGSMTCPDPSADTAAPTLSSIGVINITANSATIQWLSSLEPTSTQVGYGLLSPTTTTTKVDTLTNFHTVNITGLQPYKYYQYNVRSIDACGNETISATKSFRTLR